MRILGRPPRRDEIEPSLALVHAALAESESAASAVGGRGVGASPGVGGPQPCAVLFDEFPVSRLRRAGCSDRNRSGSRDGRSSRTPPVDSDIWPSRGSPRRPPRPNANPLAAKLPHLPARAKRVIFMFMHGGPSQVDTFDYKPTLAKYSGQPAPFVKAAPATGRARRRPRCCARLPGNSPSMARVVAGSPSCSRTSPGTWTTCASSTACTPKAAPTARPPCGCTRGPPVSSDRRSGRGSRTDWGRRTATCPASSRSPRRARTAACRTIPARSCRPSIRGRRSARPTSR